jgi:hypothetical protein
MKKQFTLLAITAFILSACGGGGSTDSNQTATDAIDKYIGTWTGACDSIGEILQTADNQSTNVIHSMKFSKLSANTASTELKITVYANSDKTCEGTPIGSIVKTGLSSNSESSGASGITSNYGTNTVTYNTNVTLTTGQKVDQLTVDESKLSADSNANFTLGQIKFSSANFSAKTLKAIAYFVNSNTAVFNSNAATDGFPTVLDQNKYTTYSKQ